MGVYIFDLDGTLADIRHRLHFIEGKKKDWDAFYDACVHDIPISNTIHVLNQLCLQEEVIICSGRSERVREQTEEWLAEYGVYYDKLLMRPIGDTRPDAELKLEWLNSGELGNSILGVFEDRDRMVKMWREQGLTCYQVCEGDY